MDMVLPYAFWSLLFIAAAGIAIAVLVW